MLDIKRLTHNNGAVHGWKNFPAVGAVGHHSSFQICDQRSQLRYPSLQGTSKHGMDTDLVIHSGYMFYEFWRRNP